MANECTPTTAKAALLLAIAKLDEAGAMALYSALTAHAQNEDEHVETLKESSSAADQAEGAAAEKGLAAINAVIRACDAAVYGALAAELALPIRPAP